MCADRVFLQFGHDDVLSLMDGINNSHSYRLDAPEYRDQRAWSFLFGGSGDGTLVNPLLLYSLPQP